MKLTHLHVQNYRGLRDISLPLSRFGCFIGKNNAGKSTVLQAISLFFSGTRLTAKDFFDATEPIRIEVQFEDIHDADLDRLAPEHKEKIEAIVVDGELTLVRHYDVSGSSKLMYVTQMPKQERFRADSIAALIKGLSKKTLSTAVLAEFPELEGKLQASTVTQAQVKDEIRTLADSLPPDQKELTDCDLPTGIDASVKALLPDPIYIPAVKNLADDVKSKESTPFGKVLAILLTAIEPKLGDVKQYFAKLSEMFNRVTQENGERTDNRLSEVQLIENTVEKYLRESFANVSLEINVPPPELKAILSSAELLIDDGVQGNIESKGDGLRRAAVFAILRSYVALNEPGAISGETVSTANDRYVLLFEEPELYLHPSAQKILFDALSTFSKKNHVLITTHSPAFFGPDATATFIKLSKATQPDVSKTPFTVAHPVNLTELNAKDQFQLICFENNNAAFFFDSVVLVEGDSDFIVLPHVAGLVMQEWEAVRAFHKFIRIGGKGSIKRYKEFFSKFSVRVAVVTDLDLLTGGFDSINPNEELRRRHSKLIASIDTIIESTSGFSEAPQGKVKAAHEKTELLGRWKHAKNVWREVQEGKAEFSLLEAAVDSFFAWEKRDQRLRVMLETDDSKVIKAKRDLLRELRNHDIFVLERGPLEAYYPSGIAGHDKPSKAQDFCRKVSTKEDVLALCDDHHDADGRCIGKEFEVICKDLFRHPDSPTAC